MSLRDAIELEQRVAVICQRMTATGIAFDVAHATALAASLSQEQTTLMAQLMAIFPARPVRAVKLTRHVNHPGFTKGSVASRITFEDFNANSADHLIERFTAQGWTPEKFTDSGKPATSDDIIRVLPYRGAAEVSRARRISKMQGQLATGDGAWLKHVSDDGRIHGEVDTLGAVTGRMSHYTPNLANVDKDPAMRRCFIAAPGRSLVDADAEGIEARLLGHFLYPISPSFSNIIENGRKQDGTDIHSRNQRACQLHCRDSAKTAIYCKTYGGGHEKLGLIVADDCLKAGVPMTETLEEAGRRVSRALMGGIQGYADFVRDLKQQTMTQGFVRALDGRKIPVDQSHVALNYLIQSAGAIIMKRALVILDSYLREGRVDAFFVANVHDEIMLETSADDAPYVADLAKVSITEAGDYYGMRCPMRGEAKIGTNWAEVH